MNEQQFLNLKYQDLCQQLGDAQIKLDKITEHIKSLKSRIENLNEAQPIMAEYKVMADRVARSSKTDKSESKSE